MVDYFSNHFNTSGAAEHPFQHMFISPQMPLGELGALFVTFLDSIFIFAVQRHLGMPFLAPQENLD